MKNSKSRINIKTYIKMQSHYQNNISIQAQDPEDSASQNDAMMNFIFVKDKEFYRKVFFNNILFIKADGVYSEVYTIKQRFLASNCLSKVLKQLNSDFIIRCHRSYAVNINRVDAYLESLLVVGEKEVEVPVGLKFKNDIFRRFPVLRSQ